MGVDASDEVHSKISGAGELPKLNIDLSAALKAPDEGDDEGGGEGGAIIWQSEIDRANLLPEERAALLDKIARGMIAEGHLAFGPKALKALGERKEKNALSAGQALQASGGGLKEHPIVPKGSGLQPQVAPEWQNEASANDSRNAQKAKQKMALKMSQKQKLSQRMTYREKLEIKPTPKFNPRPNGM